MAAWLEVLPLLGELAPDPGCEVPACETSSTSMRGNFSALSMGKSLASSKVAV